MAKREKYGNPIKEVKHSRKRFSPDERKFIFKRDNYTCQLCKKNLHKMNKKATKIEPENSPNRVYNGLAQEHSIGDFVRLRFGCIWYFGIIDVVKDNGYYECSYGTKKRFEKIKYGWSFDFFADWHESNIKSMGFNIASYLG